MLIGVPKEIKNNEYRVGLTPASVRELTGRGHRVLVESHSGVAIGFDDKRYLRAGAEMVDCAAEVYQRAQLIVKVKEPQADECNMLREGQVLFSFLHLACDAILAARLMASKVSAIAYETVTDSMGGLPLLAPMSEVAGRMSVQAGAHHLEKAQGGAGILLGGIPGVAPGTVVILGAGVVGSHAAAVAVGLGAEVVILDRNVTPLRRLQLQYGSRVSTVYATLDAIEQQVGRADLLIGAVLVAGAAAPRLITRGHLASMNDGSVVVDVAIDQGGCLETSRPTTHQAPTYVVDGVVHYCVTNIPGAVARTATLALNHATLPYILSLAEQGASAALRADSHLRAGLNVYGGCVTHEAVAGSLGVTWSDAGRLLAV
jgi:alanine dehydrogenase